MRSIRREILRLIRILISPTDSRGKNGFKNFAWAKIKNFCITESKIKFEIIWCVYFICYESYMSHSVIFKKMSHSLLFGSTFQCCDTVDESIENIILAFDRNIEWCWPAGDD